MEETDYMINLVNEKDDIDRIADYIVNITKNYFNFDEARDVAYYLVRVKNYSKEDIFNGLANNDILSIGKLTKIKRKTIQKKDEVRESVLLKTIKTKVKPKFIAASLAFILFITSMLHLESEVQKHREDAQISGLIGLSATNGNVDTNIVNRNSYAIEDEYSHSIAYDNNGIASDIVNICNKNPNLLDIVLFRTYFDMNYNRLANMDEVISSILYLAERNNLTSIREKLGGCHSFLDYVFKECVPANSEDYHLFEDSIEAYNIAKYRSRYAFDILSSDVQKRIEKLISEYKNERVDLYSEYKDDLMDLVQPNDGLKNGGRI